MFLITFRVSRRRREMYIGHARPSVCVSVRPRPYSHTTARTGMYGVPPTVVHYWADLQSVHRLRYCDNSANAKCQRVFCTRSVPGFVIFACVPMLIKTKFVYFCTYPI